jgi:membrane protease YdiL (CAAX protease family)
MKYPLSIYFALAYGISWLLWSPLWLPAFGIDHLPVLPFNHTLGAIGPISAAFIVSGFESGKNGTFDLLRRMGLWKGRLAWVAAALLGPFVLLLLSALGAKIFAGESMSLAELGHSREYPQFSALAFLFYNIISFGYGEETGWRGFALPRLQSRFSAFTATILLTFGWAIWHIPLFFYRPGYMGMGVAEITGWAFSLLTGAVLLTWLYNESRGSILVVALFHASVDIVFTSDMTSQFVVNSIGALVTLWGIIVLITAGPRYLSRQGKMVRLYNDRAVTGLLDK